jgi:peptidoglycan hydrolase CwlO-like protein
MKIVIKIALILAIVASGVALYFGNQLDTMKKFHLGRIAFLTSELRTTSNTLVKTEGDLATTSSILLATQEELAKTNAELQACEVRWGQAKREADSLKAEVDAVKAELETSKTELASSKESLQKISDALKQMGIQDVSDIETMTKKMLNLTEENRVLGGELEKMKAANTTLEAKIVELTTTPVNLRGQIVGVRNEWGFCVVNLGQNDRVQPNTLFLVYRDNTFIGKIQVTQVNASTSIANFIPEYMRTSLRDGDLVVH